MLLVIFLLFFAFQTCLGIPPDRKEALKQGMKEYEKIEVFLETDNEVKKLLEKWRQQWLDSSKLPRLKLTERQAEWWRNTSVLLGDEVDDVDDEEDIDRVSVRGKREVFDRVVSRQKRQTCDSIPAPKRRRKEWRMLSPEKRQKFIDAFNDMDLFIPDPVNDPTTSAFDIFVLWHRFSNAPGAHQGASFLPWHREFIWRLTAELQRHGYKNAFPYFDSALDQMLPNPRDSAIFGTTPQQIGTNDGVLGAPWSSSISVPIPACGSSVTRNTRSGTVAKNFLYTRARYNTIMNKPCFRDLTEGWDFDMERFHNLGHVFFGGTMGDASCSPSDPVFWMHHSNVDCLWEEFRQQNQNADDKMLEYPNTNLGARPADMAWDSDMDPFNDWGLKNIHGLSNFYGNYYYRCNPRPSSIVCSANNPCVATSLDPNPLIWCQTSTGFCIAKIGEGGECDTTWPDIQCWCPTTSQIPSCSGGTCICT